MKHMVTLDYKLMLMLSLSLWQYNHHPDEGLTSGLFQKTFGPVDGKHYYEKWTGYFNRNLWDMIAYFRGEGENGQKFCDMIAAQVELYTKNRHKWPDYELLWLPLDFTERLGPPVRRVVLEFIRRFIRHHRMNDLKGTYYYDMTEDYMERCMDDPDEYTPDDRRRITRLMASYDDGKIARLLKRMRGRAFCTGLEDGLESCLPQTDGERKLLELVREGMTLMGKGVPCIMDYQYDWIYEKEPDFMPAPLESQILLAYSTNDEIVRDMMSTFNVDMQESYNLTPVSTMLLTPETDRIFSMDDFPERFAGWFNRFVHHATHKI